MDELLARVDRFLADPISPPGWCPPEKGRWLAEAIVRDRLIRVVEIGVFGGRSLVPMAWAVQWLGLGGYVLGIDPYTFDRQTESVTLTDHVEWARDIPYEDFYAGALRLVRESGLSDCCGILRASSDEAACLVGEIDLLHIDGCHSVLASCRDVEVWLPKVRPGGVIVLDDAEWSTTQEARAALAARCDLVRGPGAWEAYRKR